MRVLAWILTMLWLATPARAAQTHAVALTSDFTTGKVSVLELETRAVLKDVATVGPDAMVRVHDGLVYVVNRFGGDNIQVLDPCQNYATVRQFSVGNGSNPQDIVFASPSKAYVSRYGSADLLVVNPASPSGAPMAPISLAPFADSDGLPEMARMALAGPYLLVACQRLTNFLPANESVIAVIDTRADTLVDADPETVGLQGIPLSFRNPVTAFVEAPEISALLIGMSGAYGALDGGVEIVLPALLQNAGLSVTEFDLGGDIADMVWESPGRAYAVAGDFTAQHLVGFDPLQATVTDTLYTGSGGFSLPDIERNDRGELWAGKNPFPASSSDPPGLLVFAGTPGSPAGPYDTGLPPIALAFLEAPCPSPVPGGLQLSTPWPNPAATRASFDLVLATAARARLEVFDLGGRRVRLLESEMAAGNSRMSWDLLDDRGHRVPAGLYVIRVQAGSLSASRRVVVVP